MRKLATVRQIKDLKPIEGADLIELAIVDGWQVVVKKGEFTVGQPCIYVEIDSFLPERPEFEFLRKSSFRTDGQGNKGYRIRTMKLKKVISQGIIFRIENLFKISEIEGEKYIIGVMKGSDSKLLNSEATLVDGNNLQNNKYQEQQDICRKDNKDVTA